MVSRRLKSIGVERVKPHVSSTVWAALRDPLGHEADAKRPSLTELAVDFKTDKWGRHRYTEHYERHFGHLRDEKFTLLEIGIGGYARSGQGGSSLRMWKAFFPRARIVGLDIQDKSFVDEPRIRTYKGSQVDKGLLERIVRDAGPVRIVIDDGSHRPEHIRETFAYLFPLIEDDGIYAIEDTQTSYWAKWGGSASLTDPSTSVAMVKDLIDGLHYEEFPDSTYVPAYSDRHVRAIHGYHNLFILEKGGNDEGSDLGAKHRRIAAEQPGFIGAPPIGEQRRPFSFPGS